MSIWETIEDHEVKEGKVSPKRWKVELEGKTLVGIYVGEHVFPKAQSTWYKFKGAWLEDNNSRRLVERFSGVVAVSKVAPLTTALQEGRLIEGRPYALKNNGVYVIQEGQWKGREGRAVSVVPLTKEQYDQAKRLLEGVPSPSQPAPVSGEVLDADIEI